MGLEPIQFYLGLATYSEVETIPLIQIRNASLRESLGFAALQRFYSLSDIEQSGLMERARPLLAKEQENHRSLSPLEKDTLEVFNQYSLTKEITSGDHFLSLLNFAPLGATFPAAPTADEAPIAEAGRNLLRALAKEPEAAFLSARELTTLSSQQSVPELFAGYKDKLDLEVRYNQWRPFLISGVLYFCLSLLLLFGFLKGQKTWPILLAYLAPLTFHVGGFLVRIYITGFAPVTNMYTTMLWVAFGGSRFSGFRLALYQNHRLVGNLLLGSSLVLLLTENFPLVLSPDMDPIVAVLRSNYWLTIHVLTITISYAAFTICMLIGNYALICTILKPMPEQFYKTYAHYAYRMNQLGVCLITAGIILGGIWADYSWGRFWGWDPKETWALIADLGFIMIFACPPYWLAKALRNSGGITGSLSPRDHGLVRSELYPGGWAALLWLFIGGRHICRRLPGNPIFHLGSGALRAPRHSALQGIILVPHPK